MRRTALVISASIAILATISFAIICANPLRRTLAPTILYLGAADARIKGHKAYKSCLAGDGGPKTQYSGRNSDPDGGYYFIECQGGKVTSIYVTYEKPVARSTGFATMQRLAGSKHIIEADSSELLPELSPEKEMQSKTRLQEPAAGLFLEAQEKKDILPQCEYFYFDNGNYAELQYQVPNFGKIARIISYKGS